MLDDGVYDGIVVDAEAEAGHDDGEPGVVRLDVAILAGPHKGEVVSVRATGTRGDPIDLLADPVTLTVVDGSPRITFDL